MFSIGTHGDLNVINPALIIGYSAISRFSGLVSFVQGQIKRDIYFLKGKIINTNSNQPSEGAVACMVRSKLITNENYKAIYQHAYQNNLAPENVARDMFDIMGGQLRENQIMASRLLVKQLAVSLVPGNYICESGTKPPAGSIMVEVDPLLDLVSALGDSLPEEKAAAWLRAHDCFMRINNVAYDALQPIIENIAHRLKNELAIPEKNIAPGNITSLMDILGISARSILVLSSLAVLVPSEPQADDMPLERPADPEVQAIRDQIRAEYLRIKDLDLFSVLEIPEDAKEDDIRKAYLSKAQQWHSDRFGDVDLGASAKNLQFINARINEAKETLTDNKKRDTYLFVLDRTRKGLPTDVNIILNAEDKFKRAELFMDQNKFQMALPILEEAIALNKGEAEFHIAIALCRVMVHGAEAEDQAKIDLENASQLDAKHGTKILLTQGRIALQLEKYKDADVIFDKVLEAEPDNEVAKRCKRLIGNRLARQYAKEEAKPKSLSLKELLTGKK